METTALRHIGWRAGLGVVLFLAAVLLMVQLSATRGPNVSDFFAREFGHPQNQNGLPDEGPRVTAAARPPATGAHAGTGGSAQVAASGGDANGIAVLPGVASPGGSLPPSQAGPAGSGSAVAGVSAVVTGQSKVSAVTTTDSKQATKDARTADKQAKQAAKTPSSTKQVSVAGATRVKHANVGAGKRVKGDVKGTSHRLTRAASGGHLRPHQGVDRRSPKSTLHRSVRHGRSASGH